MVGVEMLDQDIGQAAVGRRRGEKILKGFKPTGRSANADDRTTCGLGCGSRVVRRRNCNTPIRGKGSLVAAKRLDALRRHLCVTRSTFGTVNANPKSEFPGGNSHLPIEGEGRRARACDSTCVLARLGEGERSRPSAHPLSPA